MGNKEKKSNHIVALIFSVLFFLLPILQHVITKQFIVSKKTISSMMWPLELAIILTNKIGSLLGIGFEAMLLVVPIIIINLILFSFVGWLLGLVIEKFIQDKHTKKLVVRVIVGLFILYFILLPIKLHENRIMDYDVLEVENGFTIELNSIKADLDNNKLWIGFLVTKNFKPAKINNVEMEIIKDDKILKAKDKSPYFSVFDYVNPPFKIKLRGIYLNDNYSRSIEYVPVSKIIKILNVDYLESIN